MKIVVTGSLGNISKPLTGQLIKGGHDVIVVSSSEERIKQIEALGAKAAIGKMEDARFLAATFKGADAVYMMETLGHSFFFDKNANVLQSLIDIGHSYKEAIERSGVKRIVHLSSIGGHTGEGNGMLRFHYEIEQIIKQLPEGVAITTLRPVGFYYNFLSYIPLIKNMGMIAVNYKAEYKEPIVSPLDIADVVAEEITQPFTGRKVRYIASDELTSSEAAAILGEAIGKPDLQWVAISDEQQEQGMLSAGVNPQVAKGITEMNAARRDGRLFEDYNRHKPALGKVKLKDYAPTFAAAYRQSHSKIVKSISIPISLEKQREYHLPSLKM